MSLSRLPVICTAGSQSSPQPGRMTYDPANPLHSQADPLRSQGQAHFTSAHHASPAAKHIRMANADLVSEPVQSMLLLLPNEARKAIQHHLESKTSSRSASPINIDVLMHEMC